MDISTNGVTGGNSSATSGQVSDARSGNWLNALTAARKLNSLNITGREYAVIRDPASQRFIVVVRNEETGAVLDQFPPEEVLRMLTQLSAGVKKAGESE